MLQTSPGAGPSRLPLPSGPGINTNNKGQSIDLTEESDGEDTPVPVPVTNTAKASVSPTSAFHPTASASASRGEESPASTTPRYPHHVNVNGFASYASAAGPSASAGGSPSRSPRQPFHPQHQHQPTFGGPAYPGMNMNMSMSGNMGMNMNMGPSTIYHPHPHHPQSPSRYGNGNGGGAGGSSTSAIDLTSATIPSPPPPRAAHNPKSPLFIGAITTEAFMLYPSPVVILGCDPANSRERLDVVQFRNAEFLKVKLKYRPAGSQPKPGDAWSAPKQDVIQVMTPGMTNYIGELNRPMSDILCSIMARGLLRLEGFAMRLHPDAHKFQIKINVMLFTLPANVNYISGTLTANNLYLLDPIPPYDPYRHNDYPPYENPHGGGAISAQYAQRAANNVYGPGGWTSNFSGAIGQERINQVEVQRRQVDEVFTSLEVAGELDQSDPGPYIKTELFPHQRKALTFLLQREQDSSSLKRGKKYAERVLKKKTKGSKDKDKDKVKGKDTAEEPKEADVVATGNDANGQGEEFKDQDATTTAAAAGEGSADVTPAPEDAKLNRSDIRTLWEGIKDDKGKVRKYRNRVTGVEIKVKKGEKPPDCKGAILADDMGLGKTLSIVSLIAATRRSAKKWQKSELFTPVPETDTKPELDPSTIKTKVFGMPDTPEPDEKGKKRKRTDADLSVPPPSRATQKSRGTLLVCPMSTISNWEDQIREHWNGRVEVVGGATGTMLKPAEKKWKPPKSKKPRGAGDDDDSSDDEDELDTLKVYIYHGPSRCSDPDVIADFDIVMTSYNTLANEYSKSGASCEDTPTDTANNSDDEAGGDTSTNPRGVKPEVEAEIKANEVAEALLRKRKKATKGGTAASAGRTPERSPLQSIAWFRIVLDEAHYIKTPSTVASRAACAVDADRRIALTGTPIQNKIEDIWALFKFLRLKPIDEKAEFSKYISGPCKIGNQVGVARLQLVMRCCTLRRTKDSTADDGRKILNLPARKETQAWLDLREDERHAYEMRQKEANAQVQEFKAEGTLQKNYANVLQEILRLRQICDHVDLAMLDPVEEDFDGAVMDYEVAVNGINHHGLTQPRAQSVVCFMKDGEGAACSDCGYEYNDYFPSLEMADLEDARPKKKLPTPCLLTKCLHVYCTKCFKGSVHSGWSKRMKDTAARACGVCQTMLRLPADVIDVLPPDNSGEPQPAVDQPKRAPRKRYVRPPGEKPNLSTKMQFMLDLLMASSKKNPNSPNYDPFGLSNTDDVEELDQDGKPFIVKTVIFSQWTTMLDRIGDMLEEAQIRYARLDGTMSREDRAKACDALRYNKKTEVLLVSTRAGGVGLNLTAASRCFLVDPYWNPSVEAQAIDRIHRMGQTRPVTAIKLMINNSVEQKLHALQLKKANLAQISLNKLSRKELMAQKAEELAELFR